MRLFLVVYMSLSLLFVSCETKTTIENNSETQDELKNELISQKDIESLRYTEFELSNSSEKAVTDWQKFQELLKQTEFLKKGDFSFFSGERLLLTTFFQELSVEMPEELKTNEIMARIIVLNTKSQKLNSALRLDNIPKQERILAIKEYLIALSNVKLQINKKFEYDKNNTFLEDF